MKNVITLVKENVIDNLGIVKHQLMRGIHIKIKELIL